ncbi:homoserine kinase [Thermaurantiacus sp.]
MAVYTEVPAEDLVDFLARYGLGAPLVAKGIAEGVSNSNYLVETREGRFILTLYERRIDLGELPWFLGLMTHLAARGLPVPRPMADLEGGVVQDLLGKKAALIEFLPGVSISSPGPEHCRAVGAALARLHLAGAGYGPPRPNHLGVEASARTARKLGNRLDELEPGLAPFVAAAVERVRRGWPEGLPRGVIHADLFPDNVLFTGERVSGLIDFYFAATDLLAYDLAVTRAAWTFTTDGGEHLAVHDAALVGGYGEVRPLSGEERAALPLLGEAACLRFLLTRAQDWFENLGEAMVVRKDPLAFARRLAHYAKG